VRPPAGWTPPRNSTPILRQLDQAIAETRSMARTIRLARLAPGQWDCRFREPWLDLLGRCGTAVAGADIGKLKVARADLSAFADRLQIDEARDLWPVYGALLVNLRNVMDALDAPPLPSAVPRIVDRVGIDIEPLDLGDRDVRGWLAACIPPEIGAVTRFHHAVEAVIANPARTVRGDAREVLADVLASIPAGLPVCLIDTYVHVFFTADELIRFRALVDRLGAERDLDWVSIDPLVPLGGSADSTVLGIPVSPAIIERNRREGLFGVVGRLGYRGGRRTDAVLGLAHPGAAWLEWLEGELS